MVKVIIFIGTRSNVQITRIGINSQTLFPQPKDLVTTEEFEIRLY